MVRVEAYRPDSGQFEHMGDRAVPADVTAVFGIFDDDSSILAVTGSSANSKLIEIGLQSEVVPSRFGSMPGFFLQAVRQGPDGGTYAFGIDDVTRQTVIKRSEREKNQTHYVDVESRWAVEMTVGPEGPVVVSLEAVDAGVYDVYVQRFER